MPHMWRSAAVAAHGPPTHDNVLVVVQHSGGNDGLNTVIPFADPEYRAARPSLGIGRDHVLPITDEIGLHPSLTGVAELLENNKLSVIQGVGYPNPNRSHFESMDIWHTCHRKTQQRPDGWIGRFLDATQDVEKGGDVPALHLGSGKQPFALAAQRVRVPTVGSVHEFRLRIAPQMGATAKLDELIKIKRPGRKELLDFVSSSTAAAIQASQRVSESAADYSPSVTYPNSDLGQKLRVVAQLIDAQLAARVYYLTLDGFDTHARQGNAHTTLLRQWSEAVTAFVRDLHEHGHGHRVLVMSFSEFGRRVKENASQGTDHGAAAPMFLLGAKVRPGLIGPHPSLTDLDHGDLKFHTDFRSVYAAVLEKWLDWSSAEVLGGDYGALEVFA